MLVSDGSESEAQEKASTRRSAAATPACWSGARPARTEKTRRRAVAETEPGRVERKAPQPDSNGAAPKLMRAGRAAGRQEKPLPSGREGKRTERSKPEERDKRKRHGQCEAATSGAKRTVTRRATGRVAAKAERTGRKRRVEVGSRGKTGSNHPRQGTAARGRF